MSATFVAQLFSYLLTPIITSIYSPEEAGNLGLFVRIIAVGSALATLRYEYALPLIKNESHAYRLMVLVNRVVLIFSFFSFILLLIPLFRGGDLEDFIFYSLIPLAVILTAYFNIGTNWSIRFKKIKLIGYSRVLNATMSGLAKIGFGLLNTGYLGLIYGTIIGLFIGNLPFIKFKKETKLTYNVSRNSPRNFLIAKGQKDFPLINLPHALMDFSRDLVVGILFFYYFSSTDYGCYDLSYRMLRLPLVLVGVALGQMFFQRCSELLREGIDMKPLMVKSMVLLCALSIIPFGLILFYGVEIFAWVFGENWAQSGAFSQVMVPWFALNFIVSPISSIPLVLGRQWDFFKIAIFGTVLMLGSLIISQEFFQLGAIDSMLVVSISQVVYLVFLIVKIFQFINQHRKLEK